MKKIAIAFTWSMILSVLAGLPVGILFDWLGFAWYYGPALTTSVNILHAWLQSRTMLLEALGERKRPSMQVTGRHIPVSAGGMVARFEQSIGRTIDLELEAGIRLFTPTGVLIDEEQVKHFIGRAWSRQLQKKPGLSRKYWTVQHRPPWDREKYETMIYCLIDSQFIQGRVAGKSGLLVADYKQIIDSLKRG